MDRAARIRLGASALLLAGLLACAGYVAAFLAGGGHWYQVRTPSMGRAAPVGTLLWVEPVHTVHPGEIITFHPPTTPHRTYTHRVVTVATDGTITTRGDINGAADPWQLRTSDVVGQVTMRWWGIGWLVSAAPLLLVGGIVLAVLVAKVTTPRWRPPAIMVGIAFLLALAVYRYKPLVRGQVLSFVHVPGQPAQATFVSTGLFPTRLSATHGGHADLIDGQVGMVRTSHPAHGGKFHAMLGVHLAWWWWIVLVGVCFLPSLWSLAIGRPGLEPTPA